MSREKADALGCTIMATIGAQASYGIDMKYVLVAPIWAIPKCLKKEGIGINDVDLFEVNEAFSGSTVAAMNELGLSAEKTNVNGGSVALGHPIGASGCRVLVTLLHEMIRQDKKTGLASLCLGGGRRWRWLSNDDRVHPETASCGSYLRSHHIEFLDVALLRLRVQRGCGLDLNRKLPSLNEHG
jgi:acetyl-CoA acetyltransferase